MQNIKLVEWLASNPGLLSPKFTVLSWWTSNYISFLPLETTINWYLHHFELFVVFSPPTFSGLKTTKLQSFLFGGFNPEKVVKNFYSVV